ncbi:MAG: adenylate/guanylate cyclase domain-containing protein [Sporichthyaceae bacterium]
MPIARSFDPYVPRGVLRHLAGVPFEPVRTVPGSMLFADLSGFTKLSERLQRRGPEGAELLVGTINAVFDSLLRVAYDNGGSLVKFGGDALLLFFEGDRHAERAARSAYAMRERLRTVGRIEVAGVRGTLRMTVGVHTDEFHFFLVGDSHLDYLVLGPGAGGIVGTEGLAENGQIVVSASTAAALPARCVGASVGEAFLLRSDPLGTDLAWMEPLARPADEAVARCLSTGVRAHLAAGVHEPEHRRASVAFLHFSGTDALIAVEGRGVAPPVGGELGAHRHAAAERGGVV